MSVNGQQASNWRIQKHLLAKCQVQLSLTIETQIFNYPIRVVTKISSCRVNTTSRLGIKQLGISFGSIFLLFSNKSSRGPLS